MAERKNKILYGPTLLTDDDIYLFREGNHFKLYEKLGAHRMEVDGESGLHFAVWAPNAKAVSVVGDFNGWNTIEHPLTPRLDSSGIWEGFIPGLDFGTVYKYHVVSNYNNYSANKGDPFAFYWQEPPDTASIAWGLDYEWGDAEWMKNRGAANKQDAPISIYEVHPGSWARVPEDGNRHLTYREMADRLTRYVVETGFTHVEFLPLMEHPFYGSWGYQTTGFFAPTSRYGSPTDFMYLVDMMHQNGVGVILDWVPSHFPSDEHGPVYFDGTHLYEHQDPREGYHPDWGSYIFNYGRSEVRNFLISSALFWLEKYHVDGLRVDAVASMLYRDYSRKDGEWIPNEHGGRENLEAISFIKRFNEAVYGFFPDVMTIAEESTAWPMVSRPVYVGGLGFGFKWKMGWMHDTLEYMTKDPIHRKFHHDQLTFSIWYAFSENYVLPLSHDEVVYGKGSLLRKMPGDDWQRMANLRLLFGYMFTHPGKKLIFMGGEFAQWNEWNHETSLDWHLLDNPMHSMTRHWVGDLNRVYRSEPALHLLDNSPEGYRWIDHSDYDNSILSYVRLSGTPGEEILVVCNFTPVARYDYHAGVPTGGTWKEILNSDAEMYGGGGVGNCGSIQAAQSPRHGYSHSLTLTLPPLGILVLRAESGG